MNSTALQNIEIDHKVLAKHFGHSIQAMWKLKRRYNTKESYKWEIYVKAYNFDTGVQKNSI